ncbi:MAG: tetratricopeptide repeat protein, partial [Chitinophagaceae bacterium]|nr:tetratricopeptide repeat protein [Chitinophagaceae bacterium]
MRSIWIILLVFAWVFLSHNSFGQKQAEKSSNKKDSYNSVKSRVNTSDIQRLLRDAERIKTTDPKAALENVQEALAMSIAGEDYFNEGKSYVLLGEINESIQEWKLALDNYLNAYQKLSQSEDQVDGKNALKKVSADDGASELKKALTGLGNTNFKLGQFDDALKYYQELLTNNLSPEEKSECHLNISEVYSGLKDYDRALKVLDETNDISRKKNSSLSIRIQNQRAKIYLQQNQLDKTQKLYFNSLDDMRSGQAAANPSVQQSTQ